MKDLTQDDIRAAVSAGMITEAQAASVLTLAQDRHGARAHLAQREEPFELFKGFNEIFIVVGLGILFAGYFGLTGLGAALSNIGYVLVIIFGLIGAGAACALADYFTLKRRMVAPSIMLAAMFAVCAAMVGLGLAFWLDGDTPLSVTMAAGVSTLALVGFFLRYRVPIVMGMIGLGVFATAFGLVTLGGTFPDNFGNLFLLTNDGPFAILTIVMGIIGFVMAMWLDIGDPYRVALRSKSGFWLHVISAPAIVNTVALSLFSIETGLAYLGLLVFILALALVAIIIDRRSFLVAGVGYVVALAFTVVEESGFLVILLLGVILVLLGAQWERLRGWLMEKLPEFKGKNRLPVWGPAPAVEAAQAKD